MCGIRGHQYFSTPQKIVSQSKNRSLNVNDVSVFLATFFFLVFFFFFFVSLLFLLLLFLVREKEKTKKRKNKKHRRRMEGLRKLDLYPKTAEEYRVRTVSGAILSVTCVFFVLYLFYTELNGYLNVKVNPELSVDSSFGELLRINVDVTFHSLPCAYSGLDTMDISGFFFFLFFFFFFFFSFFFWKGGISWKRLQMFFFLKLFKFTNSILSNNPLKQKKKLQVED